MEAPAARHHLRAASVKNAEFAGIKKLSMYHTENINEKTNHHKRMARELLRWKRQAEVPGAPKAPSSKRQASSPKQEASSFKPQASSSMIRDPRNI